MKDTEGRNKGYENALASLRDAVISATHRDFHRLGRRMSHREREELRLEAAKKSMTSQTTPLLPTTQLKRRTYPRYDS